MKPWVVNVHEIIKKVTLDELFTKQSKAHHQTDASSDLFLFNVFAEQSIGDRSQKAQADTCQTVNARQ
jgi:hypothetical protein